MIKVSPLRRDPKSWTNAHSKAIKRPYIKGHIKLICMRPFDAYKNCMIDNVDKRELTKTSYICATCAKNSGHSPTENARMPTVLIFELKQYTTTVQIWRAQSEIAFELVGT